MLSRRPYLIDSANELSLGDPLDPQGTGGLVDKGTGEYVDDATVTLEELVDEDTGDDVSGVLNLPIALAYLSGSSGVYAGTIPVGADVSAGQRIIARIEVIENATLSRVFSLRFYGQSG